MQISASTSAVAAVAWTTKTNEVQISVFISGTALSIDEITHRYQSMAPYYMIPDQITKLNELPRMPNNKKDYRKIKALALSQNFSLEPSV